MLVYTHVTHNKFGIPTCCMPQHVHCCCCTDMPNFPTHRSQVDDDQGLQLVTLRLTAHDQN